MNSLSIPGDGGQSNIDPIKPFDDGDAVAMKAEAALSSREGIEGHEEIGEFSG